jgi:hypothetical protein
MTNFAYYAVGTAFFPLRAMKRFLEEPRPLETAVQAVGFVGLLYAVTSLVLALVGAVPMAPVLIGIKPENYYFWQMLFAVPCVFLAWALAAGVIYLFEKRGEAGLPFLKAAPLPGIAAAAALFVAWIPMAFGAFFMLIGMNQQELVDLLSRPGAWQVFDFALYVMAGAAGAVLLSLAAAHGRLQKAGLLRPIMAGLLAAVVLAAVFMLFVR